MGLKAVANLGGGGGGGISGSGTPGKLAKFTGATALGDSLLSESGTTITSAATAEAFGSPQTWTLPGNSSGLTINSSAGNSTFVLSTYSGGVGINVGSGGPGTLLDISDGSGYGFAGSTYEGVRLLRVTEALFSSSDGTRSVRAGLTGGTAVVGTSTAHDLLLQRNNVTAATLQNGAIATVTLTAGGTLYTNGTYSQQALTGGTGTGATADIVVAGGIVTSCVVRSPGTGYTAADALSCATIGAGAGFVVTVTTTAAIVAGSGNLTALGRIGAGKSLPTAVVDALGSIVSSASEMRTAGGVMAYGAFFSDSSSEPGGVTTLSSNSSRGVAFTDTRQLDSSARSAAGLRGFEIAPTVQNIGSGTTSFYSASLTPTIQGASIAARTMVIRSINAQPFIGTLGAGNTVSTFDGVYGGLNCSSTSVVAFTTVSELRSQTLFGGAAHTVVTHYQARFQAPILNDGSTITNRWGISQEDALARNVFSGATVIGAAAGTSPATGSKLDVLGLAANRAAGTYTIQPTAWWAGDVCSQLVVDSTAETGGLTKPTTGPGYVAAITSIPRYDLSLRGTTAVYGIQSQPLLEAATLTGTSNVTAIDGLTNLNQSGITAKTVALVGVSGGASIATVGATVTASLTGVGSTVANFAATAVAHSSVAQFLGNASTFSGAAHTITNFYGLRLRTTTLSGGATITNNWGISQEDATASNQFSAVTNTFSGIVRATGSTAAAPAFSTPADTDTGLYFPSANTVRIGTGGSPGLEVDSSQNLKFNSGYGSAATAYGCRAWVNFNGTTTITIRASGGISSITRTSAGVYVTNLSVTMPDANYSAIATKQNVASNVSCGFYDMLASRTTTAATWTCVEAALVQDAANINIAFFR